MAAHPRERTSRAPAMIVLAAAAGAALHYAGPVLEGAALDPLAALAAAGLAYAGLSVTADALWLAGEQLERMAARIPKGLKGTSGWVKGLAEIRADLIARDWGPYWGVLRAKPIFADFASNALTLGPAGSGKGVGVVQPMILAIRTSKAVVDFKGEMACVLAEALRARGEIVRILNLGDMWPEILGPSDSYNPLALIADDYQRPGGLQDVTDDVEEMALQIYPEPDGSSGKDDNRYFRDGGRSFLGFAKQTCVLISGEEATLGDVAQMLNDRASLLRHAQWAAGRLEQTDGSLAAMPIEASPWVHHHDRQDLQNYIAYFRGLASGVADLLETADSRTADSFLTGAQQALARFNITTRAHKKTARSSFRFSQMKEGDAATTVFLVADAARINAQKPVLGLIQWCLLQELKRHPNKHRPVHVIADEATNFKIAGLGSLLTWGRAYGVKLHLILQSLSAFRSVYGQDVLNTLLSETEIKQFLAGQREPETLKLIEQLLAQQSIIVKSQSGRRSDAFGVDGYDYREDAKPLMTADEIRRCKRSILIIRQNKPILASLPPIAAIAPWRRQIGINPFHGKPFLRPVALRLRRGAGLVTRAIRFFTQIWRTRS